MPSPYLIADEHVRLLTKALNPVPCDSLDSNQARQQAYRDAGVPTAREFGNVALDHEAAKRQRIRRRQLGITVFALTVIASVQNAAASVGMEAISGELGQQISWAAGMAGVLAVGGSLFLAVLYSLKMLAAWLAIRHERHVRVERDAADEIWG